MSKGSIVGRQIPLAVHLWVYWPVWYIFRSTGRQAVNVFCYPHFHLNPRLLQINLIKISFPNFLYYAKFHIEKLKEQV